mgnify:CR=1 FL=1
MGEKKTGNRVTGGVLLFGLALAAILAAVGYRALDGADADTDESPPATPLEALEARVAEEPGDAAAWQELGFTRYGRGEFGAAATAYREATALEPDTAVLWSAYGEALVMDSKRDPLPPEAPFDRISLTLPALLASDALVFVIRGDDKREILNQAIAAGKPSPKNLPLDNGTRPPSLRAPPIPQVFI